MKDEGARDGERRTMTDARTQDGGKGPVAYDDDRLLAFVLGLADEPGLPAAAEADPELGARLAAMRADVAAVGAQLRAAVPAPDEPYTDLSAGRWPKLHELFEAPAPTGPRRPRRWWRVLAPVVAVLVVAVAIGVVSVDRQAPMSSKSAAEVAQPESGGAEAVEDHGADTVATSVRRTAAEGLADQLDQFAVVVLARAHRATNASQRFLVVRIFKGDAPPVVELDVGGVPADEGRLHLLMLDPVAAYREDLTTPPAGAAGLLAEGDLEFGEPLPVAYTYHGEATLVREFGAGTDPDSVSLPIP